MEKEITYSTKRSVLRKVTDFSKDVIIDALSRKANVSRIKEVRNLLKRKTIKEEWKLVVGGRQNLERHLDALDERA